jgi:hypothetical protein
MAHAAAAGAPIAVLAVPSRIAMSPTFQGRRSKPTARLVAGADSSCLVLFEQHRQADVRESVPVTLRCNQRGIITRVGPGPQVSVDLGADAVGEYHGATL